jgi:hypothetical protein
MVICNFNIHWPGFRPFEADPVLIINANAVLTFAFSFEFLQAISRGDSKFVERNNRVKLIKLPGDNISDIPGTYFQRSLCGCSIE